MIEASVSLVSPKPQAALSKSAHPTVYSCESLISELCHVYLKGGSGGSLKHLPDALFALGAALQVGEGVDLLSHGPTLLRLHRLLLHLAQLLDRVGIIPKILKTISEVKFRSHQLITTFSHLFVANEDDGDIGAEMFDLRGPFLWDVL